LFFLGGNHEKDWHGSGSFYKNLWWSVVFLGMRLLKEYAVMPNAHEISDNKYRSFLANRKIETVCAFFIHFILDHYGTIENR
jgi:hypothetical protein